MRFFQIDLSVPPEITHAHSYETTHYAMQFGMRSSFCEISFFERGRVLSDNPEEGIICEEGAIHASIRDYALFRHSDAPLHRHFTVGLSLSQPVIPMTVSQVAAWTPRDHIAIIPETIPPGKATELPEKAIKQIINAHNSMDKTHFLVLRTALSELFCVLTEYSMSLASESESHAQRQNQYYCRRAVQYITRHICERIDTKAVADYVGVSYGYLSRIFRAGMGMSLVEYINRTKIRRVQELIAVQKITLEEAGAAVEIEDVKYLSRVFKKYTGITPAAYRSLYHARRNRAVTPTKMTQTELAAVPETKDQ